MLSEFTKTSEKQVLKRFREDHATAQRLKYGPYYCSFEKQCGTRVWHEGKEKVMLSSNDYLGLTMHPKVIEAGKRALEKWGSSTTGARLSNGTRAYHSELEERIAAFLGKEACHVHAAGYLSCMSSIASFAQKGDLILIDRNVHSSLWTGVGITQAEVERFGHNNVEDLKEVLRIESPERAKFLVVEGIYSMEGHIAPMKDFVEVVEGQNCIIILDDAHGLGVLGERGRGTAAYWGMTHEVDIITGSLSKSLAGTGGYVAGSRSMIEYLRSHSKQTIFSAAISPVQSACALAALEIMENEPEHLERLWGNTRAYKKILDDLGLDTWGSETPAIPIVLGDKAKAYYFWKGLMDKGVFTVMSIAPAVPPGKDLVRTAISAQHTKKDLEWIAEAMAYAAKQL